LEVAGARRLTPYPPHPPSDARLRTPRHLAEKILTSRSALEGERKQVTVLFADVKGSMDLAEQVDPEEWHGIMDRFFTILSDGVHRYEGTVSQYIGDGIMALFGAPLAHEDHARRACYAALRLAEELRRYSDELRRARGLNFSVRMGINSGEVVVGKIGDDLRMEYTAQGHTVGLAARMEQLAEPGRVYLTEHTARLVEGFFRLNGLGEFNVKGVHQPLRVYELQGLGPLRTRIEVAARRGLVQFVGRREEMEQLRRAWEAVQTGRGQIVAVMGEAGVGKSRLFHEFKAPLQSECLALEAYSVSHGKAYAYLPLIELLKDYFRITLEDDERTRREKITGRVLTLDRKLEDTLPYVFALLGIADPTSSLQEMDGQIRRRRTMEAIRRLLVRETLNQPLVLIFEDLHWVDGETQAFLDVLIESVATAKILLLVNYRPEYAHGWASKTYYSRVRLDPLGKEESEELLTSLLGSGAAEGMKPLRRLILEKTEGNPFFMEEVVRTLAEEAILTGDRGSYRLQKAARELHIPTTVQGVLAARIDRLPLREKGLLQTLAVIGKEFTFGLVREVTGEPEEELHGLLLHLQTGEFICEEPAFPEPEYMFKHALTQDVAYGSVLVERRKMLHERAAWAMENLYRDSLDEHYGDLARHYSRTDSTATAVKFLHLAGLQAAERSAYDEAIGRLGTGLDLIQKLPEGPERDRQELALQIALGPLLRDTKGFTAAEVRRAYTRARVLCQTIGKTSELFTALNGLWLYYEIVGDLEEARKLAGELLTLVERSDGSSLLARAHGSMGATLYWCGELHGSLAHLQQEFDLDHPQKHRPDALGGEELQRLMANRSYQANVLWNLGYSDQALRASRITLALAQQLARPSALALALLWNAGLHLLLRESQAALERAEALITLSTEHGFPQYMVFGMLTRGRALADLGQAEEGIAEMRGALDAARTAGADLTRPYYLIVLAESYKDAGKPEEGLPLADEAFAVMNRTGQRVFAPFIDRTKGDLLVALSTDKHVEAEECFHGAIQTARRQANKRSELWAATSLARLWKSQGKRTEGRDLLAETCGWFTEGFDTRDLKEAKALLEELA